MQPRLRSARRSRLRWTRTPGCCRRSETSAAQASSSEPKQRKTCTSWVCIWSGSGDMVTCKSQSTDSARMPDRFPSLWMY